jgi:HK97 family phage portal protein
MGILSRLWPFRGRAEPNEEASSPQIDDPLLRAILFGEGLDKAMALSVPAVNASASLVADIFAMLEIRLYKEKAGGQKSEEVFSDERTQLLNRDSGDTLAPYQMKRALALDALLDKGAFLFIDKTARGRVRSLRYVKPSDVYAQTNNEPIFRDCYYMVRGKKYQQWQFVTVIRETQDGMSGPPLPKQIEETLRAAFETIKFESGMAAKSGMYKGYLSVDDRMSRGDLDMLKGAWQSIVSGGSNSLVLNKGAEFHQISSTPQELQLSERKKSLAQEIERLFRVDGAFEDMVKRAVVPLISAFESALNKSLLLESEKGSYYFAFDTTELLRGSVKDRYAAYAEGIKAGFLTRNEARRKEDLDPIEGLDVLVLGLGDVLYDPASKEYFIPNMDRQTAAGEKKPEGPEEEEEEEKEGGGEDGNQG